MRKQIRPYGTWTSPLSPKALAGNLRLNDVQWDSESDALVWLEGRGAQGVLVVQQGGDAPHDLTSDLSVRARVGYGGGDFTVSHGYVYFAGPNGRLYKQAISGGAAKPITPAFGAAASPRVSPDGRWLTYIHTYERTDGLAMVDSNGEMWPAKMAFGTDFVMQPAWHPQGKYFAYVAWNHPQMPWDGTELHLISMDYDPNGTPGILANQVIAGSTTNAIFQPEFSPDGRYLAYISDSTGWGQLYVYDLESKTHTVLTEEEAEHGAPAWGQGMRTFGWAYDSHCLYFLRNQQGVFGLWRYNMHKQEESRLSGLEDYSYFSQIAVSPRHNALALIAGSSRIPSRIISYVPDSMALPETISPNTPSIQVVVDEPEGGVKILRRSSTENLLPGQLSEAKPITWTGHDDETVHGLYYAPTSDQYEGEGLPPLIVSVHGGPTGQTMTSYSGAAQFFASRGYAYLEVNYRGSTGYGKAYMNKLLASWGVYDVEDAASGAAHLAKEGLADPTKLVILGGSAGGFTVLQSLIDKQKFYKAGVCLYGVSNQFLLAMETHKFEERYLDSILGPLPQASELYRERSPYFHANKIIDPIIVFQGEDDEVVPRNQSDSIVASLKARNIPHEYHVYAGEGHGWRKVETIEDYYTRVLKFLQQYVVFG